MPPAYVACMPNRVVVPARQAGSRFLGSVKGLQIRAQCWQSNANKKNGNYKSRQREKQKYQQTDRKVDREMIGKTDRRYTAGMTDRQTNTETERQDRQTASQVDRHTYYQEDRQTAKGRMHIAKKTESNKIQTSQNKLILPGLSTPGPDFGDLLKSGDFLKYIYNLGFSLQRELILFCLAVSLFSFPANLNLNLFLQQSEENRTQNRKTIFANILYF
jgi:hypothetical protein